ncbi:MAG: 6-phosphofructokinase [Oligoflexales bacterium]
MKKIGICTGGGDCPGLNAAIRCVVKHAIHTHKMQVIGIRDSFQGLQKRPVAAFELFYDHVADILHKGGTILGTYNKGDNFKSADGKKKIALTLEGFKSLGLDALIVVGGEGTQTMASQLHEAGIPTIGIPKTIDNDLPETDQTIGFSSCIELVNESVMRLQSTAESHDRVMVLEVMGRDSGFIALQGGVAGGANVILIPEIPFTYESICTKIKYRQSLGRNYSLVVVSEGAFPKGEEAKYKLNMSGAKNLGGIGQIVADELQSRTKMDTRITVLGHLQRGGQPNTSDKILATRFAIHAVDLATKGETGRVVVLKSNQITSVPYEKIKNHERRKISMDDDLLKASEDIGICLGR